MFIVSLATDYNRLFLQSFHQKCSSLLAVSQETQSPFVSMCLGNNTISSFIYYVFIKDTQRVIIVIK